MPADKDCALYGGTYKANSNSPNCIKCGFRIYPTTAPGKSVLPCMEELVAEQQFNFAAEFPLSWSWAAAQLFRSAEIIYIQYQEAIERNLQRDVVNPKHQGSRYLVGEEERDSLDSNLIGVCLMLVGYAIESLAKGILSFTTKTLLDENGKLRYITHDLEWLFKECNISTNAQEKVALSYLTEFIMWRGKYPIPLSVKGLKDDHKMPYRDIYHAGKAIHQRLLLLLAQTTTPPNDRVER